MSVVLGLEIDFNFLFGYLVLFEGNLFIGKW